MTTLMLVTAFAATLIASPTAAQAGREVATVIANEEIAMVAEGPGPKTGGSRVDVLKGGDYLRAWLNHANANYIVNLPVAASARP